jgi:hypothetical protein
MDRLAYIGEAFSFGSPARRWRCFDVWPLGRLFQISLASAHMHHLSQPFNFSVVDQHALCSMTRRLVSFVFVFCFCLFFCVKRVLFVQP